MSKLKAEFTKEFYYNLPNLLRSEMTIISVDSEEFKEDAEWIELKEASNQAFRKLKKREYILREHLNIK